jgi:hypothetical protein
MIDKFFLAKCITQNVSVGKLALQHYGKQIFGMTNGDGDSDKK